MPDSAGTNSFVHLHLTAAPSGRVFTWHPKTGDRPAV